MTLPLSLFVLFYILMLAVGPETPRGGRGGGGGGRGGGGGGGVCF